MKKMSVKQANIVTIGGVGVMLLIAGLPAIWNVGILGLTVGGCIGLSMNNK